MYPAAAILGATKPGISTGQGIEEMERICDEVLSPGMAFEWTEINYMQIDAAKNIWNSLIFPLAVVFVFLVLAAQYESWALPLAVILVVPMCILGSLTGVWRDGRRHQHLHADRLRGPGRLGEQKRDPDRRVRQAQARRRRPVAARGDAGGVPAASPADPDDSFAFILGVVPLLVGHGAGAEMRRMLGIAVFSGMLGVTLFGIFLTPVFFYVIEGFIEVPLFAASAASRCSGAGCCRIEPGCCRHACAAAPSVDRSPSRSTGVAASRPIATADGDMRAERRLKAAPVHRQSSRDVRDPSQREDRG